MTNWTSNTPRTTVLETDQLVGLRGTAPAAGQKPESRWTAAVVKTWLDSLFAPLVHAHTLEDISDAADKADASALTAHTERTDNPHAVTKTQVGLSNVDNTADAAKPVSTAAQTALDLKAPLASPALTGTPTAPTAANGTASTQLATTLFVANALAAVINGAPGSLDTLQELADALGEDPNFATTITNALAAKLAKSANLADLTDASAARTNLALVPGTHVQAFSALLGALAGLTSAADKLPYFTGENAAAVTTITSYARSVLAAVDAAGARDLLGFGTGTPTAAGLALLNASDADAQKTALALATSDLIAPPVYFMAAFYWWDPNYFWAFGSADGKQWSQLSPEPIWRKASGETSTTDPRIFRYKGRWYICYSTGWLYTSNSFGLITSEDFVTWTKVMNVPVTGIPGKTTYRAWSPKPFIDDDGQLYIYISISHTDTEDGPFISYAVTPTADDLTSWSAPAAVTGIDTLGANAVTNYIDGSPVKVGSTYYFWFKDEDNSVIQYATASSPLGPYTVQTTGDWAGFGSPREGISMVQITDTRWRIYFEEYPLGGFRWSESDDLFTTWSTPVRFDPDHDPKSNPGVLKVNDAGVGQMLLGMLMQSSKPANYQKISFNRSGHAVTIYANLWYDSVASTFKHVQTTRPSWQLWMDYGNDQVAFVRYPVGSNSAAVMWLIDNAGNYTSVGALKSNHATAGIGYATGAGGTVTQTTSRATGVTLNKACGRITTDTTSLAAGDSASFTVTCTACGENDVPQVAIKSGATNKKTTARVTAVAAGSFEITVHNLDASTAETGAIVLNFSILKGVVS